MHPPGAGTVLVRYGEVGIKSPQLRGRMEQQLQTNLLAVLNDRRLDADVTRENTRLYVDTDPALIDDVTAAVTDTFGIVSASPARRVDPTRAAIMDALVETAREHYTGQSYAVRVDRAGPKSAHPFASTELEREGGDVIGAIAREANVEPTVDLDEPELTFAVECRPEHAYIFLDRQSGPGGLPLGTQEPLVALVSGGIDSPVAAWLAMKRGAPVYPLYVDLGEYTGVDHRARVEETVATLGAYAPNYDTRLRVAPAGETIEAIAADLDMYRMLAVRRFMFKIAAAVAADLGAVGIVTGESTGQKSSQTTTNLRLTSAATELPVHRPLLSTDKSTISQRAAEIGTYPDSTIDTGCHLLAPDRPATRPPLEQVRTAEPADLDRRAAQAAADRTVADSSST
jgi:thiamine biosynthesis protein ThiI